MKYLLSVMTSLIVGLSGCSNIPVTVQEETPTEATSEQSTQAVASTEMSSENSIEIIGGDEESMQDFIRQWDPPVNMDGRYPNLTFYLGSAPKDIPYDLPTPDDARIIGSVTGGWIDYFLIFETSLTPDSVHEFYARALKDKGWRESFFNQRGGLISDSYFWKDYCYGENEALLGIETRSISADKTSIRLHLHPSPDVLACKADSDSEVPDMYLIPALRPPKGMTVQEGDANSGDGEAQMNATLRGDLSPAEVVDFYNEQLLAAGWKMVESGDGEGKAWSNWRFTHEQGAEWIGALRVDEESSNSDTLLASMTIEEIK